MKGRPRYSVVDRAKHIYEKVADADFDTKLRSSGFVLPPRSSLTIQDMINLHNMQKLKEERDRWGGA